MNEKNLKFLVLLVPFVALLYVTDVYSTGNWYGQVFRKVHLDYHLNPWVRGAAAAVTLQEARRQVRLLRQAGVQAVEIFAYDHFGHAFYPSEVVPRHPDLTQDYFGNMSRAARDLGLKVIAYVNVFGSVHLFEKHPDWYVVDKEGQHPPASWLPQDRSRICASSPFQEKVLKPLLAEFITRYSPDAIWLDAGSWLVEAHCYCHYCREQYRRFSGEEIPERPRPQSSDDDWRKWQNWRLWRRSQIYDYLITITQYIHQLQPGILVTDNNMGRFNMGVPVLENGALARWALPQELGLDFLSCDPVPFFGNHVVILSRLGRYQSTLGLPFDFMNERFQGWGEWHIRETTDFKLECATIISNQGRCFIADQPWPDGTLEPAVYARVKETYDFVKAREDVYREAEVLSRIGILAAETTNTMLTEKWLSRLRTGSRNLLILPAPARTDAVDGAYLVLVQGGLQFQIFSEANLTGALPRLRLLIVPEQVMMLDDTWVRIQSYVEQGGRLLITGQTGLLRYDGGKRTETHLETLLGVNLEGEYPAPLNYLQFPAGFRSQFHLPDLPIMLRGPMNRLGGAQGEVLASVLEPREEAWDADGKWRSYTVFGAMPPRDEPSGPAVVYRKIGKGEVLYATGNWFGTYYREGNPTVRKILAAFLSTLLPEEERLLVVQKPLQVEVNLMRNEKGYLVSLANSAIQKQSRQFVHAEELPAAQNIHVRLRIEDGVSQVKLLPEGTSLDFKHSSGQLTFAVPELWIHSAVQITVKKEN